MSYSDFPTQEAEYMPYFPTLDPNTLAFSTLDNMFDASASASYLSDVEFIQSNFYPTFTGTTPNCPNTLNAASNAFPTFDESLAPGDAYPSFTSSALNSPTMLNAAANAFSPSDELFDQDNAPFSTGTVLNSPTMLNMAADNLSPHLSPQDDLDSLFGDGLDEVFDDNIDSLIDYGVDETLDDGHDEAIHDDHDEVINDGLDEALNDGLDEGLDDGFGEALDEGLDEVLNEVLGGDLGDDSDGKLLDGGLDDVLDNDIGADLDHGHDDYYSDNCIDDLSDDVSDMGDVKEDSPYQSFQQNDALSTQQQDEDVEAELNHLPIYPSPQDTVDTDFASPDELYYGINVNKLFDSGSDHANNTIGAYAGRHGAVTHQLGAATDVDMPSNNYMSVDQTYTYPTPGEDSDISEGIVAGAVQKSSRRNPRGKSKKNPVALRSPRRSRQSSTANQAVKDARVTKPEEKEDPVKAKLRMGTAAIKAQKATGLLANMFGENIRIITAPSGRVKIEGVYWTPPRNDLTIPRTEGEMRQCAEKLFTAITNAQGCKESASSTSFKNRWGPEASHYTMEDLVCGCWDIVVSHSHHQDNCDYSLTDSCFRISWWTCTPTGGGRRFWTPPCGSRSKEPCSSPSKRGSRGWCTSSRYVFTTPFLRSTFADVSRRCPSGPARTC
jgi:hypothetical protein